MKIFDESLYCQECDKEISVAEYNFLGCLCEECFEIIENLDPYFGQGSPEERNEK